MGVPKIWKKDIIILKRYFSLVKSFTPKGHPEQKVEKGEKVSGMSPLNFFELRAKTPGPYRVKNI